MIEEARNNEIMNTKRSTARRRIGVLTVAALASASSLIAATTHTAAAATDLYLCATTSTASITNPSDPTGPLMDVDFAGFVEMAAPGNCATAIPVLGDPTPLRLIEGETYNVHLENLTGELINFSSAGLTGVPDLVGVADGGSAVYTFTASTPGTYLYESDLDPRHSLFGLHGVAVVDPAGTGPASANGTAVSEYDVEKVVLLSEVDLDFNNAPDPFAVSLLDFEPDVFLINGETHTDDTPIAPIVASDGQRLLLRYVNAGATNSSMGSLGLRQSLVAFDGEIFDGSFATSDEQPHDVSQVFLTAGQTADAIVGVTGAVGDEYTIYNRNLRTTDIGDAGAQLIKIEVGAGGVNPTAAIYLSFASSNRNYNGVNVRDEDVAVYSNGVLSLFFDGSLYGLGDIDPNDPLDGLAVDGASDDIDAVHVSATGKMYFSFRADVPNPGSIFTGLPDPLEANDVYVFDPGTAAPGDETVAVWLDTSLIGLSDNDLDHNINAVHVDENTGQTYFSTNGRIRTADQVPIQNGVNIYAGWRNEDIMLLTPAAPGTLALGWTLGVVPFGGPTFDGEDFGLGPENVDALVIAGTDVLFSLTTEFPNAGTALPATWAGPADRDDLLGCLGFTRAVLPSTTDTCLVPVTVEFDADILHATNAGNVDGYSIG